MQTLLKTINEASNKLHDATTPKEAAQVAEDVIAELDAIETLTDKAIAEASSELSEFVENGALKKTVPGSDMDYAAVLSDTIAEAYNKVNGAESVEAAEAKLEEAKNDILNALKEQVKFYLETVYNQGKAYNDMVLTEAKYNAYLSGIESAETAENIIGTYEAALGDRYSLSAEQSRGVKELADFVENSDLKKTVPGSDMDYAAVLSKTVLAANGTIQSAESKEAVDKAVADGEASILSALKEQLEFYLDTLYNNGEIYYGRVLTKTKYDFYKNSIANAESIKDAIFEYEYIVNDRPTEEAFKTEISNTFTSWYENDEYLKHKIPGSDLDYLAVEPVRSAISEFYSTLWACSTVEDIEPLVGEYKIKINNAVVDLIKYLLDEVYNEGLGYSWEGMDEDKDLRILLESDYEEAKTVLEAEDTDYKKAIETYEAVLAKRLTKDEYNTKVARDDSIEQLENLYPESNYTKNHDAWENAMNKAKEAINSKKLTTPEAVNDEFNKQNTALGEIETDSELKEKLDKAIGKRLEQLDIYIAKLQETIAVPSGDEAETQAKYIDKCSTVTTTLEEAKQQVQAIGSTEELDALMPKLRQSLFNATKADLQQLLKDTYYTVELTEEDKTLKHDEYYQIYNAIGEVGYDANKVDGIITAYEGIKEKTLATMEKIKEEFKIDDEFSNAEDLGTIPGKEVAKVVFGDEVDEFRKVEEIKQVQEELKTTLSNAKSLKDINSFISDAGQKVLTTLKDAVKKLADELKKPGNAEGKFLSQTEYNDLLKVLNNAKGVDAEGKDTTGTDVKAVYKAYKDAYASMLSRTKDLANDTTLSKSASGLDTAVKAAQNDKAKGLAGISYNKDTNTVTFMVNTTTAKEGNLYNFLQVKDQENSIVDMFKTFATDATKAEYTIEGKEKVTITDLPTKIQNEGNPKDGIIGVAAKLLLDMAGQDHTDDDFVQKALKLNYEDMIKDTAKPAVATFYFTSVDGVEYTVTYTLEFVSNT